MVDSCRAAVQGPHGRGMLTISSWQAYPPVCLTRLTASRLSHDALRPQPARGQADWQAVGGAAPGKEAQVTEWDTPWRVLVWTFTAACAFTLASAWAPALKALPVLTWLGFPAATAWGWVLAPALGYVGQVARPSAAVSPRPPPRRRNGNIKFRG